MGKEGDAIFYLSLLIVMTLLFVPIITPTLFSVTSFSAKPSFGSLLLFLMLFLIIIGVIYFIYEKVRKYKHKRFLFEWMPTNSLIFGLIPFILQNLILFFAVSYQSDLGPSAVYFYLFPLLFVMVLLIYVYLENKSEGKIDILKMTGFYSKNGKMLLLSIGLGLLLGASLFYVMNLTSSTVRQTVMPFSDSIMAKMMMNQALASMNSRITFYIVFFLLVGLGEELLCYFGLQVFSNYFYSLGMNKWYSIIAGSLVARSLWALEHWASWGAVGLFNMANYLLAVTVGIMIFTISGILVYYKDYSKPTQEYLLFAPWMAHFIYDLLVTLHMEGILQSIIMSL